ncbi:replicative DNA helicase [bacterium]|jgi:replicative DNA helicase|nr:replicative DNA helicase [bacterium]
MDEDRLQSIPPHNLEAEQNLLATLLNFPEKVQDLQGKVRREDFYKKIHQEVYQAILDLDSSGDEVDFVTVGDRLDSSRTYQEQDGRVYLEGLMQIVPGSANPATYAKILTDKSRRRKLIHILREFMSRSFDTSEEMEFLLQEVEQRVFGVADFSSEKSYRPAREIADESWEIIAQLHNQDDSQTRGVPSGFKDLDQLTNGFQESDMIVVGARPSMGKTALCLQLALHASLKCEVPTIIYSLEMAGKQLINRMLSGIAEIDGMNLQKGRLSDNEISRLTRALGQIDAAPLFINEYAGMTLPDIRNDLRRLGRKLSRGKNPQKLGLVIIDYLQLILSFDKKPNEQERIAEISRGLKGIAREFKVPIIVLSQLSRKVEDRKEKQPMLSDLRESGAIEQDADLVIMVHREEYYSPDKPEFRGITDLLVRKHRNGPTGDVKVHFDRRTGTFKDLARTDGLGGTM